MEPEKNKKLIQNKINKEREGGERERKRMNSSINMII